MGVLTTEGAKASRISSELKLRRSIMSCLLWEKNFYEDEMTVADRIEELVKKVDESKVHEMAVEARNKMKIRHTSLYMACLLAKKSYKKLDELLYEIIQRPDELSEFLSLYWEDKKQPLTAKMKKGLAKAFTKFDEYQLAKYNKQDVPIKLRDVLFLCHAKPINDEQGALWKKLVNKELKIPDTWEVSLSAGKDKKETFERLISEKKLGALAFLRNLRNMIGAKVDESIIREGLKKIKVEKVLPFRFISAAKYAPQFEKELEEAMYKCVANQEKLKGKTIFVIDTSGSMYGSKISQKSELSRVGIAASLAVLIREICENPIIYATAGNDSTRVHATKFLPSRRGFALKDLICNQSLINELGNGGIFLTQCMKHLYEKEKDAERIIVITDEQDCDTDVNKSPSKAKTFGKKNYLINISCEKNGIGYRNWVHIDGWSEAVIDYIKAAEQLEEIKD
jgi:hypothetical protein